MCEGAVYARVCMCMQVLRSLLPPKSATHGGLRGRRSGGAPAQAAWLSSHGWHNFAAGAAVPTDAAVRRTANPLQCRPHP